jgi:hypothetical protein
MYANICILASTEALVEQRGTRKSELRPYVPSIELTLHENTPFSISVWNGHEAVALALLLDGRVDHNQFVSDILLS